MRILSIAGSPRRHGNSIGLLRAALEGAMSRGHTAELLEARDLQVQPCVACEGCKRGEKCVVDDDMNIIYESLQDMEALVIATPIYFYSMSGWLKAIVDRIYALIDSNYISRLPSGKKLYVITTQEEPDPSDGEAVVEVLSRAFKWVGMELAGSLVAVELLRTKDYKKNPELLKAARILI